MKITKIADMIITSSVKDFYESGNEVSCSESLIEENPDIKPHLIYAALRLLDSEGLITVQYGDDEPQNFAINVKAIKNCDENTWLKKGYRFAKEIKSWL